MDEVQVALLLVVNNDFSTVVRLYPTKEKAQIALIEHEIARIVEMRDRTADELHYLSQLRTLFEAGILDKGVAVASKAVNEPWFSVGKVYPEVIEIRRFAIPVKTTVRDTATPPPKSAKDRAMEDLLNLFTKK